MGARFSTEADGIGDIRISGLYRLPDRGGHTVHLSAGLSLPTGSIDERDATPMGPDQKLPYPMQLGSGTWDLFGGITYRSMSGPWQWGGQADGLFRLGENENDYTLGNRFHLTGWLGRKLLPWLNVSGRLDWNLPAGERLKACAAALSSIGAEIGVDLVVIYPEEEADLGGAP